MLGQTGFLLVKQGNGAPHKLIHGLVGPALNVPLDHFFQLRSQMNLYDHSLPQVLTLLRFFARSKNSIPLFSNDSTLLQKKNGGVDRVTMLFAKPKLQLTVPSLIAFLEGDRPALSSFLVSLPPYFLASLPLPVTSPQTLYHSTLLTSS